MTTTDGSFERPDKLQIDDATASIVKTDNKLKSASVDECDTEKAIQMALIVMRVAVFVDAANLLVMGPNLSYLVIPGWHEDSFPNTGAFGFSGAQYFITMTSDLGGATGSYFWGKLSDRSGRRIPFLISLVASVVMCVLRYFLQNFFYAYAIAGLIQGFFSPCTALGMAYASDLLPNREAKDKEINTVQAINMAGRTGGGVLGILLGRVGLFVPLLAAAGLNMVAAILAYFYLIEPPKKDYFGGDSTTHISTDESSALEKGRQQAERANSNETEDVATGCDDVASCKASPEACSEQSSEEPNQSLLWNINIGAFADNMGSAGLVPICLTPLMFDAYYADFVKDDENPILSEEGFKWIYVMIALAVIPGAVVSPYLYQTIGPAFACVLANIFTGCITLVLFYITLMSKKVASFAIFVVILYCSFPFTVISQLSTGPMLDRIVPARMRGEIQGLHMVIVSLGYAFAPFLLGNLADEFGVSVAIWTAFGISLLAAVINLPLTFASVLKLDGQAAMPDR